MSFDPLQLFLEDSGVHRGSNSQSGSSLGSVEVHSLTFSHTPRSMKCDSRASLLAHIFVSSYLGHEPEARVVTLVVHQVMWPWVLPHLHHLGVVHVPTKSRAQLLNCLSPFERGWNRLKNALSCCNKVRPIPNGPPNLVDPLPHNSFRIVKWLNSPSRFVHRFGVERRCSSWAPTPCVSIGLAKICSWTLGLDPTLCLLGGHDA
jgi:hypothetical protein